MVEFYKACIYSDCRIFYYRYTHPLEDRESPVVIGGDYITTETGTGLVHTAPGHGQEDYITGQKYGLPLLSPVDDDGNYTEEAGKYAGLNVLGDGNLAMVEALDENDSLLMEEPYGDSRCFTGATVIWILCMLTKAAMHCLRQFSIHSKLPVFRGSGGMAGWRCRLVDNYWVGVHWV